MFRAERTTAVVVGGGVAGSAVAINLVRAGVPTTVVEQGPTRWRAGETLPPSARPLLEGLGVWRRFLEDGHLPSHRNQSAWGGPELTEREFIFNPYGSGWHLDRVRFDGMLAAAAQEAGARWRSGTTVTHAAARGPGGWRLELDSKGPVSAVAADIVVDATGRSSRFARAQGARRRADDRMLAIAGVLGRPAGNGPSQAPDETLIEAVERGWWYSAAVPDGRVVAVYATDPDLVPVRRARTRPGWSALLEETVHVRRMIEAAVPDGAMLAPPHVRAAGSARLEPVAGDTWLAVGDAAASHDPLSSQGILAAMGSARSAAAAVVSRLGGDSEAPRRYAQAAASAYARYLVQRRGYYRLERRWPTSAFWRRRQYLPAAVPPVRDLVSAQGARR